MSFKSLIYCVLALLLLPLAASAHRLNESYVYFDVTDDSLGGRFEANVVDLVQVLPLDTDGNGDVTEEELQANGLEIFAFFQDRLELIDDGQVRPIAFTELTTLATAEGVFVQVGFTVPDITATPSSIDVDYEPLADVLGPSHAGFALIASNTRLGLEENEFYISLFFSPQDGPQTLSLDGEPLGKLFLDYLEHGIWHVWLAFDHLVFLAALLLGAVMITRDGRWEPHSPFQPAIMSIIGIVAVFSISNAVTLALTALGIVQVPPVVVNTVIALCIALIALMNIFPALHGRVLWIALVFGLFHGLGSADELTPLGLEPGQLTVGLSAFTIGMLMGQLAIVVAVFPLLWLIRRWSLYVPLALKLGSVAMIGLLGIWFLEQTTTFEWNVRATIAFFTGGGA